MAKNIEPKLKKIGDYLKLEEDTVFTIPEYQRAYSWGVDNCDKLWQDINHLHPVVTSGTAKRLKKVLGADVKISIQEYADELRVQTLSTAHRKKKQHITEMLDALPALERGGLDKLLK